MPSLLKPLTLGLSVILAAGCSHVPKESEKAPALTDNNLNSTLWVQTSGEYKANALQAYNAAIANLGGVVRLGNQSAALEQEGNVGSLPAAVVLDIDETVLDNSKYQANLVLTGSSFNPKTWDQWIAKKDASAVPGAVEFINYAKSTGVEVFYITNRECMPRETSSDPCPQEADTLANLQSVGIQGATKNHLLMKKEFPDWGSEKTSRRTNVAEQYRIVMLFGDDLGDFLPGIKSMTPTERDSMVSEHSNKWGSVWYMLPNPTYGSWQRVLKGAPEGHLKGY
jgi:5'-nucleotidase (lipoprotein e(P4) family)